jgi:hypothetical protein
MYDYPPYTGECDICNKQIKHEKSWIRHLKTKTHKNNEMKLFKNSSKTPQNSSKTPQKLLKTPQNSSKTPQNSSKISWKEKIYICNFCNKETKRIDNHKRHIEKCKVLKINNITTQNIDNSTTNNITNNTNNTFDNSKNIHINIYGKEDLKDVLSIESYFNLINKSGSELLENFLELAYIKEVSNRNIKYTNLRSNNCRVLVAPDKWEVRDIDDVLDDRINKSSNKIKEMLKHFLVTSIPNDGEYLQKQLDQSDKASEDLKNVSEQKNEKKIHKVKKNHKMDIYNIS